MTVTELSIKRPSLIVAAFTLLGLLGTWGYRSLQYELLPKITPPVVTISTVYPGASPEEVETGVSRVIEDAVSGLEKVDSIRTTSREGFSMVVVEFLQTANIDTSLQDVQRKVNQAQGDLPDDAERPVLSKLALDEIPVLRVGVSGENIDPRSLYQLTDDQVRPRLSKVPGVGQISLTGGDRREIQINLDASKLRAYRLSAPQVLAALRAGNLELPAGRIEPGSGQYVVRLAGKVDSVRAIGDIIVSRSAGGGEVRISDVAEVHDGVSDPDNITRVNGRDSIGLVVSKQTDANAVEVSRLVREQLTALEKTYADKGVTFFVAQDTSTFTVDAASAVKVDLSLAIFLVALVMLLFLHSLRSSLIVMVAIPASLVSTFFVMYVAGFSLNLMTLLALSLVVGILVDDSIVVLENIFRRLELGDAPRDAALRGRNEIGFTALAITLVDIAVFVPMAMVTGTTGAIVRPFAVVVAVSTLFSLIVSFTITPALASRFTRIEHLNPHTLYGRFSLAFERGYERLTGQYTSLLRWSLQHRWVIGLIALSLFFASAQLGRLGLIGQEFVAVSDRGEFTVFLELPPGARLENTNAAALQVEQLLFSMPEVDRVFTDVGASGEGLIGLSSPDEAQLNVALVPKEKRVKTTAEIEQEIKHRVSGIPGIKVRVNPIGLFGTANETPVQLSVVGPARAAVTQTGDLLVQAAQTVPGTEDVRLSSEDG
ncbi:MAG TPA: efflux RND transporter permease subunit, partial [Myxococcaceae bacterium]|nr:efflux RND transporter permease subunit [Myxococcaceae bacterium]